jgi:hypothetical protein
MEDAFDKSEFHSAVSEKVSALNEIFSEVMTTFEETCEFIEEKDDITFAGGGVHGIIELLEQYRHRLLSVDQLYHKKFGELQVHEDKMKRFEKAVLQSLDNITITDAHDER